MASIISTKTTSGGGIAVTGDTSGVMQLASADGTTAVTIDASQNVGIGTASPTQKLQVTGNAVISSNLTVGQAGAGDSVLQVYSVYGGLRVGYNSTNTNYYDADTQIFRNTAGTERMRIDASGYILNGTTSAINTSNIQVAFNNNTVAGMTFKCNSTSYNLAAINFLNQGGTQVGYIYPQASSTQYSTSSDYRLKENIAPMIGALDKVLLLKPVTYKWKIDNSDGQGFIAHELAEIVPDCVTGEKDAVDAEGNPVYQGIDTSFLVATLTAAIQEQQVIITDLKARIEVLEAK